MNNDERREEMERITAAIARSMTNKNMRKSERKAIDRIDGEIIKASEEGMSSYYIYEKEWEELEYFYNVDLMKNVCRYYKSQGFEVFSDTTGVTIIW